MKVFLNSYQPLVLYRAGRQAINKYSLPPFIDYSCRKEPDFMSKYPSITALCRVDKFVPRLREGDIAVYITSKNRYRHVAGSPDEKHWRLVAIIKVLKRFETHEAAAAWYLEQGEKLPSNCMVEGNPPFPLEMTAPITEFKTDRDKWDDEYQARVGQCSVFLACTTQWMNLYDPPVMTERIMCDILGRIRGTQTPPEITFEELIRLKRYYGI